MAELGEPPKNLFKGHSPVRVGRSLKTDFKLIFVKGIK